MTVTPIEVARGIVSILNLTNETETQSTYAKADELYQLLDKWGIDHSRIEKKATYTEAEVLTIFWDAGMPAPDWDGWAVEERDFTYLLIDIAVEARLNKAIE